MDYEHIRFRRSEKASLNEFYLSFNMNAAQEITYREEMGERYK